MRSSHQHHCSPSIGGPSQGFRVVLLDEWAERNLTVRKPCIPWFYHKSPLPWQYGSGSKAMADCQTNQIDHLNSQVSLIRSFDRQVLPYRHTCLWPKKIAVTTAGVSSTHYQTTHCIASKKSMRFNRIEDIFLHWTFCIQVTARLEERGSAINLQALSCIILWTVQVEPQFKTSCDLPDPRYSFILIQLNKCQQFGQP